MNDQPIQEKHIRRFRRLARDMDKLLKEIDAYCPGANLYLQESTWHLMIGPSHESRPDRIGQDVARPERSVANEFVAFSGGGAW
jgi:hypothetical protein